MVLVTNERQRPDPSAGGWARQWLRDLEFVLPMALQRAFFRVSGGRFDPYTAANHSRRAIFVHVPRTAGTSIAHAAGLAANHFPISRFALFNAEACSGYFKFAFVRNPWDRFYSAWSHLRAAAAKDFPFADTVWARRHLLSHGDFNSFVLSLHTPANRRRVMRYIHFRPQLSWISYPGSVRIELDFVGRFEQLEVDFDAVANRLEVETVLPMSNASERVDYRDAYSDRSRVIVGDLYKDDVEAFGYAF